MPTYNIVFDSEGEWRKCPLDLLPRSSFPQQKQSQWLARFLADVDWRMIHTSPIEAQHAITRAMLRPFLPSASCPRPQSLLPAPSLPSSSGRYNIMFCCFCIFVPSGTSNYRGPFSVSRKHLIWPILLVISFIFPNTVIACQGATVETLLCVQPQFVSARVID